MRLVYFHYFKNVGWLLSHGSSVVLLAPSVAAMCCVVELDARAPAKAVAARTAVKAVATRQAVAAGGG